MFVIRSGRFRFEVDGKSRVLSTGEIALAQPGVVHGYQNDGSEIGSLYEIKFTVPSAPLTKQLQALPPLMPQSSFTDVLIDELVEEGQRQQLSTAPMLVSYMLSILHYCMRHFGRQPQEEAAYINSDGFSDISKRVVNCLEANCMRDVSLQELADTIGLNKNYLCTAFKKDTGITIGACHTAIRIRKAAEMISFSDMELAQVAEATGFCNPGHFNRIFKKVVGIPPGQYRRMYSNSMFTEESASSMDEYVDLANQNGFIVAILARKKMSAADILQGLQNTDDA